MFIYICSPYAAYENHSVADNIVHARRECRKAVELGYNPLASHLFYTQFLNDNNPSERETGLRLGLEMLGLCEELWVCSEHISGGMKAEIEQAKQLGIKIVYKGA